MGLVPCGSLCAYAVEHACVSNWSQNRERQYISIVESDGFNWLLLAHNSMQACNRAHRFKGACTSSIANKTREGHDKTTRGVSEIRRRWKHTGKCCIEGRAEHTVVRHRRGCPTVVGCRTPWCCYWTSEWIGRGWGRPRWHCQTRCWPAQS